MGFWETVLTCLGIIAILLIIRMLFRWIMEIS